LERRSRERAERFLYRWGWIEEPLSNGRIHRRNVTIFKAIDADDENEGIRTIADWIVEAIRSENALPGSRNVCREAVAFCRENGDEIRNDEWLGV
jgi:hypothetical protein